VLFVDVFAFSSATPFVVSVLKKGGSIRSNMQPWYQPAKFAWHTQNPRRAWL
jgi:hypothetical protein